jgi:Xaa-Pro aminopeptidase
MRPREINGDDTNMSTVVQAELESKRDRLRRVMREKDLEVVVASSFQGVSYLAGTYIYTQIVVPDRLAFCLCFADGSTAIVLCSLETSTIASQTDVRTIVEYTEFAEDPTTVLARYLEERGLASARIGIESQRLPIRSGQTLDRILPAATFVPIDDELEELQGVKTPVEIDMLREAGVRTLDSVLTGIAFAEAGDTELDLCARIGTELSRRGGAPTFTFFGSGARALGSHIEPTTAPLVKGDLWRIDLGGRFFELANSDMARTGVIGEPTAQQEDMLQTLLEIQAAGTAALEPGRPASDVFNIVKGEFARRDMEFLMPHIGHGIGIGIHEFPLLQPLNHAPLEAGMIVTIEPMYRAYDLGECYHVEDLVLVTEEGHELLTQPQERLLRVEI